MKDTVTSGEKGLNNASRKRLVIIGGGFGGVNLAKYIDKKIWDVVIIDMNNYHSFPPLFYQVASSGLEPSSISFPLRREMRHRKLKGCRFHMGEVNRIDTDSKTVSTQFETIPYDKLVIAAGTTNNFFNIPDLEKKVYTLKSTSEAIRCRNAILSHLERACVTRDEKERERMLTFVIVGGGPTGVEIAGALGEMKRFIVPKEYKSFPMDMVKVVLLEGTDRLLRTMSEKSSQDALRDLGKLMVDVRLGVTMQEYTTDGIVKLSDGTQIITDTVIWTAGVTGRKFELGNDIELPKAPGNRIAVDEYNKVEGMNDVYAIGDIAYHAAEKYPHGCPQLAQGAIQQGRNLARTLNGKKTPLPFEYKDKGSMATIGRNKAVVDMGKVHFNGWFAWMTWMLVHLITLMGFRNKAVALFNWTYNYLTFSSGLRLILKQSKMPEKQIDNLYGTDGQN